MKKYPYPDKKITTKKQIREHVEAVVFNGMNWLGIDGYLFFVLFEGDEGWSKRDEAGLCVHVDHPYKKFHVSVQEDSVKKYFKADPKDPLWRNVERSIFHELLHVLMWEYSLLAQRRYIQSRDLEEAEEKLVDHLAIVIHEIVGRLRAKKK